MVPAQILFERGSLRQSERRDDPSTDSGQVFLLGSLAVLITIV